MGPVNKIRFFAHQFSLELTCGITIFYPLDWFPSLANAKIEDLKKCRVVDDLISWPYLAFQISLQELIQMYLDSDPTINNEMLEKK